MWNVVRRVGLPGRVRIGLGVILCAGLAGCSDGWPLGVDDPVVGVQLRADRDSYPLDGSGELVLINRYRYSISHGTFCSARVERRVEGEWLEQGWLGSVCIGPLLVLQPGERYTAGFAVRGAPVSANDRVYPGAFRFGGAHRVCIDVGVRGDPFENWIAVCTDPFQVELPEWTPPLVSLAAGGDHTCGVTASGMAYCWGSGHYGELGDGESDGGHRQNRPVPVEGEHRFAAVTAGGMHTCGLVEGGEAYCWGRAHAGQLGTGSVQASAVPAAVAGGLRFNSLTAGFDHTCGLTEGGEAYCWGSGHFGQLGNGSTAPATTPAEVAGGHRFASLSAGTTHTCGVTEDGDAYCWGFNGQGQLGSEGPQGSSVPVLVAGDLSFSDVAAGEAHTCGLTSARLALCWGRNAEGQLGDGDSQAHRSAPGAVSGGRSFLSIGAGDRHSCAVADDGVLYCWGKGTLGQVGSGSWGDAAGQPRPLPVFGGHPYAAVVGGENHTCGLREGGTAYCWGLNQRGQLGDGTWVNSNRPLAVVPPLPETP